MHSEHTRWWRVRALRWSLAASLLLVTAEVFVQWGFTFWQAWFTDSLTQKNIQAFWFYLSWLPGIMLVAGVIDYLASLASNAWVMALRAAQGEHDGAHFLDAAAWSATMPGARIDMVQSMVEDSRQYAEGQAKLLQGLVKSLARLLLFGTLLAVLFPVWHWGTWTLPAPMLLFSVAVFALSAWLMHLSGASLPQAENARTQAEAAYRAQVARVKENSRGAGQLAGNAWEAGSWSAAFEKVVERARQVARKQARLLFVSQFVGPSDILALIVLSPIYFAGEISFGQYFQASMAHSAMGGALSWFADAYPQWAHWTATSARLRQWRAEVGALRLQSQLQRIEGCELCAVEGLRLWVPGESETAPVWQQRYPDFSFGSGQAVLIKAPSGWGKSTLLSALAGAWPWAEGRIQWPQAAVVVPQKPYFPMAGLLEAVCYPHAPWPGAWEEVQVLLERLGLIHLAVKAQEAQDWNASLSGGEAARLGLVRALLAKPRWLFLDEPTAHLDTENAQQYWEQVNALQGVTLVLIAHAEHQLPAPYRVLDLLTESKA